MSLSQPLFRSFLAVSLIVPTLTYIAYRWQKSRNQVPEDPPSPESVCQAANCLLEFEEVQQRLQSISRSRLETLEEEVVEDNTVGDTETPQAVTKDAIVIKGESVVKTKVVPLAVFASTDIRYRDIVPSDTKVNKVNTTEMVEVAIDEELFEEALDDEIEMPITVIQTRSQEKIPDVLSALHDPLCMAFPPSPRDSYTSSPVKSEASSEGRQSTEWSDLIEQDERDNFQQELSSKLSGLELEVERTRCGDSGVVSPSEGSEGERERQLSECASKTRSHSGEDPGLGSEEGDVCSELGAGIEANFEETQLMSYQFHIPDYLCGKLIGANGAFIKKLKEDCRCNIILKEYEGDKPKKKGKSRNKKETKYSDGVTKVCSIEGTRSSIDKCLDLVKLKFSQNRDEVSFKQVNAGERPVPSLAMNTGSVSLSLAEGCMHEVFVSSIVGGGHVFLQQPYHPTFTALERLDQCMTRTYTQFQCPPLPTPVQTNTVCVAPCDGGWYRCQVVSVDTVSEQCDIKYLDYGGYHTLPITDLRQIRTDFLTLPFQAIECYLANISPTDDQNVSAFVLEELIARQIVQARMIGTNETGVPMIHLYRAVAGQTTMVNRELVDRHCAHWLDTTIVQLESPDTLSASA